MDRQATQPAAVPSGRKRRRVSKKQKQEEEALDKQASQPPTSELVIALNALPKATDLTPLPTPSPTDQSVN